MRKERTVKRHGLPLNVALQVFWEATMCKVRTCDFVLAKQQE